MSAGPFLDAFYESETGDIHPIKVQPETASLAIGQVTNAIPAGPANNAQRVLVSAGRNSYGVKARKVRIEMVTATTQGDAIAAGSILELPWFQADTFLAVTRPGGQQGTYRGGTCRVVGGSPEYFR